MMLQYKGHTKTLGLFIGCYELVHLKQVNEC